MKTQNQLIEQRAGLAKQLSDLVKSVENRTFNADEEAKFDKIEADIKVLDSSLERHERAVKYLAEQAEPIKEIRKDQGKDDEAEYRNALLDYVKKREGMSLESRSILEKRTQVVGTDSAGGYAVAPVMDDQIYKVIADFGGVLGIVTPKNTATGGPLYITKTDYTSQEGEWLTEVQANTSLDIVLSRITMGAYDLSSKSGKLSYNVIQDSEFNLKSDLLDVCARRSAVSLAKKLHNGTGSSQMQGFMNGAALGKTTASATVFTYDEIVDFMHSLPTAYRPGAFLLFNDITLKAFRKLKDSTGQPLWQPGMVGGVPGTIHGVPYQIVHEMADYGTSGNKFMAYANLNLCFRIRRVKGNVLLAKEFPDTRETEFYLHSRWDSKVIDDNGIKYMAHA